MTNFEVKAGDNICDFCSEPNPTRTFNVPDFTMDRSPGLPEYRSKGTWVACSTCGTYIDEGNWDSLTARAVDRLMKKYGGTLPRRILVDTVNRAHELFRLHYKPEVKS